MKLIALLRAAALALATAATAATAQSAPGAFAHGLWRAPLPANWQAQPPASTMRTAQYRVPGARGAADGEVAVFFFGTGQGGAQEANIERWKSQFSQPDGRPVNPRISRYKVGALPVTVVELNGTYARGVGMGPQGDARPDQTLLVAMIETPEGRYTFQLYGPRATVAAHRKGFEALVRGFKRG